MKFTNRLLQFVRGCVAVLVLYSVGAAMLVRNGVAASYPDPTRVLVVYRMGDIDSNGNGIGDSLELAQYYAAKRNVPQANLLGLNISVSSYYYSPGQYGLFYSDMVAPIKVQLASLGTKNIDVILLAGDLPRVVYDGSNTLLSIDNALMGINVLGSASNSPIPSGANPYFAATPGFSADVGHFSHASFKYQGTDMYLVTHLGSNSSLSGIDKVAQSVYADKYVYPHPGYYYGTAYVDSQWGVAGGSQLYTDAYLSSQSAVQSGDYSIVGNADMNIAYAEHWVTAAGFPLKWENTTDAIVIGQTGAMFSDGTSALTAPRALFYGGWYNFDNYNNVYQWLAGSVACDLNSAPVFGTQALLHGASAASYVVDEPYLNGHQRPNILYYYILRGYDYAEASALATPFIGWMAVNEGDPLYAPTQSKTPVVDTTAPALEAGYPQSTASTTTGITTVNLPIIDSPAPEVATAALNYGPNTNYGSVANSAPGFSITPSVSLPSTAGQTWHYQVTLTDPVGNTWTSGDFTYAGNAPPTIATPAAAAPNAVTGSTAAVTVLGADDGGESNLTYTWSATGPASVAFNTNGTNASKNSTATFSAAGAYSFRVVVTDAFGSTVTSSVSVTVNQTASQVAVVPASASLVIGQAQQFAATVNDQFGNPIAQAPVTWSATGGGTISSGVFTAGSKAGGPFTVSAASGRLIGTASVSVFANGNTPPTVPANVSASAVSASSITVSFSASTDNFGVPGYTIYRNGAQVGTSTSTTYTDANLVPNTTYTYTVSAYDAVGNVSAQSAPASATTLGGLTTALLIAGAPAELGLPAGTTSATTNNLSISPSINQYGLTGTLRVTGTGSVNFSPAVSGNGVYFLNCCANTNNANFHFTGAAVGSLFNTNQGQVSFYLQSRYSFGQRTANASTTRYAFDVRDANGHQFNFATQVSSGSLEFSYTVAGTPEFYFVPKGTENTLFGSGVVLQVTLSWNAGTVGLYLNGTLVNSAPYTAVTPNWTAASILDLGAYEYLTYGGYDVSDDVVAEFTALSNSGGSIVPVVSITSPSSGAVLNGTVTVTANATDSLGLTGVQFKLDGVNLGSVVTGAGPVYSTSWNAATATNGSHTLTAVATDAAGNTASSSVSVTVDTTPPIVSMTAPINGALLNGTTTVTANATDSAGMMGVQFKLDGVNLGSVVTGAGPAYSISWNAATATKGSHTLTAVATDAAGNTASSSVSVTVDTTRPTVSMTAPVSGALLNKTVAVTANATDSMGVRGVQFQLDGTNVGSVVTGAGPAYSISWNAATATNGPHTLTAVATDAAGNTASSSVSVTVSTIPPVISLTAPASGASVNGVITVTATAADSIPLVSVQFQLDGANLGSAVAGSGPAYSLSWDSTTVPDGPHTLTALAVDAAGNVGAATGVSVTVNNPLLIIQSGATEVSGVTSGSVVTPTVAPAGFTGSVVVNGTGSVNFSPAQTGTGVYFLNCCANTNNAYYKFAGASVASVFGSAQGQITFNLQSRYTFAQRSANPTNRRYAFDVRDGNGHQFYFMSQVVSGALEFSYAAAGADWYYYVPTGTENTLFGNGVTLQVTLSWNGSTMNLFLNNMLVKSTPYTPPVYNWNAISNFDLGAYEYLIFGGYYGSDDIVNEFTVLPFSSN